MVVWLSRINKELASPTGDNKKEHTRKRALPDYPFTTHRLSLIELPPVFGALAHGNLVLSASSVRKRESEPWQWTVKIEFGLIIATVAIVGGNSSPIWGFRELWHCVLRQALLNLRMIQKIDLSPRNWIFFDNYLSQVTSPCIYQVGLNEKLYRLV